jgi:hypothetical protein
MQPDVSPYYDGFEIIDLMTREDSRFTKPHVAAKLFSIHFKHEISQYEYVLNKIYNHAGSLIHISG